MPIYEQLVRSSLVLESCLSFTRWRFSRQAKGRLSTAGCSCSYKVYTHPVSEILQAHYTNTNIQLASVDLLCLSPLFHVSISPSHSPTQPRVKTTFVERLTELACSLLQRYLYLSVPRNLNSCSNPHFHVSILSFQMF